MIFWGCTEENILCTGIKNSIYVCVWGGDVNSVNEVLQKYRKISYLLILESSGSNNRLKKHQLTHNICKTQTCFNFKSLYYNKV